MDKMYVTKLALDMGITMVSAVNGLDEDATMQDEKATAKQERSFFVCPVCRFTFGVESQNKEAVVCPGCNYMVALDEPKGGLRSAQDILEDLDNISKCEWEIEDTPKIQENTWTNVLILGILSLGTLGIGYVSAVVLSVDKQAVAAAVEEKLDFVQLAQQHLEAFFDTNEEELAWGMVDQSLTTRDEFSEYNSKSGFLSANKSILGNGRLLNEEALANEQRVSFELNFRGQQRIAVNFVDGKPKIDFGSLSGSNQFNPSMMKAGEERDLRVIATAGKNYDFTYSEDEWFCLKLSFQDETEFFYAYVKREDRELLRAVQTGPNLASGQKMIVRLSKIADAEIEDQTSIRRFKLTSLQSLDWIYP